MAFTNDAVVGGPVRAADWNDAALRVAALELGIANVINIKSPPYNAVGDGIADDTAAIAAALPASAGKFLYFPPGTYLTAGPFHLVSSQTQIIGRGKASIIKVKNGTTLTGGLFQASNRDGVWLKDLVIDLNKAGTSNPASDAAGMAVYFNGTTSTGITDCGLDNVEIKNGWRLGVRATGNSGGPFPLEVTIKNCKIKNCDKRGIFVERGTSVKILHNRLSGNNATETTGMQIQVTSSAGADDDDLLIDGNTCIDGANGGIAVAFCENIRIVNNYCARNGTAGLGIAAWGIVVSEDTKFFTVSNNRCLDNYHGGITLDLRTAASETIKNAHGTVSGNVCSGSLNLHGIYAQYAKGVSITGNHCYNNFLDGIDVSNGGQIFAITGNVCWSNGRYGIIVQDGGGATADCGGHVIDGNNCYTNATANYLDTATIPNTWGDNESDTSTSMAAAATLTVPPELKMITVTGATNITAITANGKRTLTILWGAGATFDLTDGGNLKLAGTFAAADADDTLTMRCDGTNYYELSRSVN